MLPQVNGETTNIIAFFCEYHEETNKLEENEFKYHDVEKQTVIVKT